MDRFYRMERSVRSFAYIQARHLQLLLADSYMCLPLDFPRPCYPMIAAIPTDKEGGPEKPFQKSASALKTLFFLLFLADFVKWQHA